jgi:HK97 family phage prohead protease
LNENGEGLQCAVNLPDVSYANDLFTSISRGDISQMSFAFQVGDQTWTDEPMESDDPLYDPTQRDQIRKIRTIHSVSRLDDISFVAYPAYPQTTASAHYSSARDPVIAHSIGELWPEGQPTEVRSHMLDVVNRSTHEARRNIWNMFL